MNLPNYDNWLVAPMERAEAESERFYDWCEEHNISPDDPLAERHYEDWLAQWDEPDYDEFDEYERDDFYYDY